MEKEVKELLNKCDNCKLKQCEGCEFTYTDIQKIKKYVEQKESILDKVTDKLKEDIENADNNIKHMKEKTILQTIARELAVGMNDYAREILNLIEGGKR